MGDPAPRWIGVGIPAADEADRLAVCLDAVLAAADDVDVPVVVVVAADACTDGTAAVARAVLRRGGAPGWRDGLVVEVAHRRAGAARAAALDAALARCPSGVPADRAWLATTDADTVVDPTWLARQLRWAAAGADGVAGLVDVAWEQPPVGLATRHDAAVALLGTGPGHGHVHGANLGVRASRWVEVGGCGDAAVGEDHELWRRLRAVGADLRAVDDVRVRTSGRLRSRAPLGFAHGHLATLLTPDTPTPAVA